MVCFNETRVSAITTYQGDGRRSDDPRLGHSKVGFQSRNNDILTLTDSKFKTSLNWKTPYAHQFAGVLDNVLVLLNARRFEHTPNVETNLAKPGGALIKDTLHVPHTTPSETLEKSWHKRFLLQRQQCYCIFKGQRNTLYKGCLN